MSRDGVKIKQCKQDAVGLSDELKPYRKSQPFTTRATHIKSSMETVLRQVTQGIRNLRPQ